MDNLEQYVVYFNGLLNLAIIGFVIRFTLIMKNAFKEKEDILQKRLDAFDEDLRRTEKWAERNQEKLKEEKNELEKKLEEVLVKANIDLESFDLVNAVQQINSEFKESLAVISAKIEKLEIFDNTNYEVSISLGKAFAANGEWYKAASHYDLVTRYITDNWELYFYKAVAYANSRKGFETDLKALQAYADAVVYMPTDLEPNQRSRLFIYKGAMLKRLNRLDEAENSIKLGLNFANKSYELNDGLYNLSCIYAMKGEVRNFNETSLKLKKNEPRKFDYLIQRLEEYAPGFYTGSQSE